MKTLSTLVASFLLTLSLSGQSLSPNQILEPLGATWPTYNGDYSGRRFSQLKQVNASNVRNLRLAWAYDSGNWTIKATPLMVGVCLLYTTTSPRD